MLVAGSISHGERERRGQLEALSACAQRESAPCCVPVLRPNCNCVVVVLGVSKRERPAQTLIQCESQIQVSCRRRRHRKRCGILNTPSLPRPRRARPPARPHLIIFALLPPSLSPLVVALDWAGHIECSLASRLQRPFSLPKTETGSVLLLPPQKRTQKRPFSRPSVLRSVSSRTSTPAALEEEEDDVDSSPLASTCPPSPQAS